MRDELIRDGHFAIFSEDIRIKRSLTSNKSIKRSPISEKTKEHAQARAANLIIVLMEDSPGASAEVHDFCDDPVIRTKLQIMIPKRYKKGYGAKGAVKDFQDANGGGGVYWYGERDLKCCNVVDEALKRAQAMRNLMFRLRTKGLW